MEHNAVKYDTQSFVQVLDNLCVDKFVNYDLFMLFSQRMGWMANFVPEIIFRNMDPTGGLTNPLSSSCLAASSRPGNQQNHLMWFQK